MFFPAIVVSFHSKVRWFSKSLKVCVLDVSGSMGSRNKIDDLTLGFCNSLWWIVMSVTCGYMKRKMIDLEIWWPSKCKHFNLVNCTSISITEELDWVIDGDSMTWFTKHVLAWITCPAYQGTQKRCFPKNWTAMERHWRYYWKQYFWCESTRLSTSIYRGVRPWWVGFRPWWVGMEVLYVLWDGGSSELSVMTPCEVSKCPIQQPTISLMKITIVGYCWLPFLKMTPDSHFESGDSEKEAWCFCSSSFP